MDGKYQIELYQRQNGTVPFRNWLGSLRDFQAVARIRGRLTRIRAGNFGQARALGGGVSELKIDIGTAKDYWREYQGE